MGLQFDIKYQSGCENVATYVLSRANLSELVQMAVSSISNDLWQTIQQGYTQNPVVWEIVQRVQASTDGRREFYIGRVRLWYPTAWISNTLCCNGFIPQLRVVILGFKP